MSGQYSRCEDACLIEPLEVEALLDAAAADDAVARGLVARGNPVIEGVREKGRAEGKAEGRAEGKAEGNAEAILGVLEARGLSPSPTMRQRILGTKDLDQLGQWLKRAAVVTSADEILGDF